MRIVSVNVGLPREIVWKGVTVRTAIFKEPVAGAVAIRELNLAGDQQADLSVHGGSDKAVYAYPAEHYEYWRKQLPDVSLSWGAFGENLTTDALWEDTLCVGDLLRVGSAVLQITQPRMPCYKLALRFNRDDMIKRFLLSGRSGFYFSVIEQGGCRCWIKGRDLRPRCQRYSAPIPWSDARSGTASASHERRFVAAELENSTTSEGTKVSRATNRVRFLRDLSHTYETWPRAGRECRPRYDKRPHHQKNSRVRLPAEQTHWRNVV